MLARVRTVVLPTFTPRLASLGLLCLLLAGWAQAARADVFRCLDGAGNAVYTSKTEGYHDCHKVKLETLPKVNSVSPGTTAQTHRPRVLKGSVYRVVRADGSIEYTNVAPKRGAGHTVTRLFTYLDVCAACALHSPIDWKTVPLDMDSYRQAVRRSAHRYGVQPAFVRAIIHAESAFKANALSRKGAQGLMQLMPATARSLGVADAFDGSQNIRGGARYLAQLLKEFGGDRKLVAAAYNAGPAAVRKYHGVPPYAETRVYVQRVQTLYRRYSKALAKTSTDAAGKAVVQPDKPATSATTRP